jgi:hypothetical protein
MKPAAKILLLGPLALVSGAPAGDEGHPPPERSQSDTWDRTRQGMQDWWQRSSEGAGEIWSDTKQGSEKLWNHAWEAAGGAWDSTREMLQGEKPDTFGTIWDQVLPELQEALTLQERQAELPKSAWLGEDQASNQEAIHALLDEAVAILSTSDLQDYRDRIRTLQARIAETRQAIADDRQRRVSAPRKSMVKDTIEDLDRAIAAREAEIAGYQKDLSRIRQAFAKDLRETGLDLSDEQIELLLSTVVGDNLVDLGVVFDNVKAITLQLEKLIEKSGEDLQSARRYYGMYVVLIECLDRMQRQVEQAISGSYIPQIDAIITRAEALGTETRALQERSPDKADLLAANLDAQRLTIRAAGIYRDYLSEQGRKVSEARRELASDIAAAWNTYETVRVSGELVVLIRSSGKLLDGLLDRQVPALRPFANLELQREFEKLTIQLRRGEET